MISALHLNQKDLPEKIIYFLVVLLPITLVTGPFLSDFSVSLIALLFLYTTFKKKIFFYYQNIFSKIFGIFFLLLLTVSVLSIDPIISLKKTIVYFRFWIFALAVWYIFDIKKDLIKYLIVSFTFIFIILIIDGYIQFFFKENILGWPLQEYRVSSLFKDELILGSYLSRLLPIFFAMLVYSNFENKTYQYLTFFIIFVGSESLTFLSGERVAFFYINFSSLFLILAMKNYKLFRGLSIIISLIVIFFLVNLYPKSTERIITKTLSQLEISTDETYTIKDLIPKKVFSIEYQNLYTSSLRMFYDYKITGVGPRMFRYLCVEKKYHIWEGCSSHPHNNYIQLLAETGLIGFIIVIGIFLTLIYSIVKHLLFKFIYEKVIFNDFQLCLLSAILISMWPLIPTGDFFNNWLNVIYFFPVGFFLSSLTVEKHK
jgi:O-antigen ligase